MSAAQRLGPAALAAEVRHDDDEPGLAREPAGLVQDRREAAVGGAVDRHALGEQALEADLRVRPAARRQHLLRPARREHGQPAAVARGGAADDVRDALGDVGLQPVGGAERHRRGEVDDEPGREDPLGHLQAHVRDTGARARRGVELAHVVAELVGAQLRELGAAAHAGRRAIAGEHARPAARERQRHRVDERRRDRSGTLARGRDPQRVHLRGHHDLRGVVVALVGRDTPDWWPGLPTAASRRLRMSSALTLSDSAS